METIGQERPNVGGFLEKASVVRSHFRGEYLEGLLGSLLATSFLMYESILPRDWPVPIAARIASSSVVVAPVNSDSERLHLTARCRSTSLF